MSEKNKNIKYPKTFQAIDLYFSKPDIKLSEAAKQIGVSYQAIYESAKRRGIKIKSRERTNNKLDNMYDELKEKHNLTAQNLQEPTGKRGRPPLPKNQLKVKNLVRVHSKSKYVPQEVQDKIDKKVAELERKHYDFSNL